MREGDGMKRMSCVALCLAMLFLWGCSPQEQEKEDTQTLYLLTEVQDVGDEGEIFYRMTYSYDKRGLVTGYEIDEPVCEEEWDPQEMVYFTRRLPCDGVVDQSGSYTYDGHGNLVEVTDEKYLIGLSGRRIDYTYDFSGRIESYTIGKVGGEYDQAYDLEYDDEVIRCWYQGADGPILIAEYVYENERLESIYYPERFTGPETHVFTYEGDHMVRYIYESGIGDDERLFTYDQDGRLLTSDTYYGEHQFSYEEGMLASIDGIPFTVETKKDGTLEARYSTFVLTYTPMALKEADAEKAESIWRLIFGEAGSTKMDLSDALCSGVVFPHALQDTVLMVPKIYLDL